MCALEQLTEQAQTGIDLDAEQARQAAQSMADESVADVDKAGFLRALSAKGETAVEVAAFAGCFRELAIDPGVEPWAGRAIDVCGTGGDGFGTFNISTAVSFLVAAAGVPVFKHGNRSITSKCGSADLLEALGIRLQAPHDVLRESLASLNYCFFFAPAFHPAFKAIMPVRKALAAEGQRSIFNLLGPLINPGCPAHQLLGVYADHWVGPLAEALGTLGLSRGLVVHGKPLPDAALDELSCAGSNTYAGFGSLAGQSGALDVREYGLSPCNPSELKGGDVADNLVILKDLFSGDASKVSTGLRDSVLLNAGAALWAAGAAADLRSGIESARSVLSSGAALDWLDRAKDFYEGVSN
ncbi:anthranilate phosphoribosyltransferase [Coraliomargarita parva]|uniref:anthranilate phosphoribosyltransferase n=1 Tax=Coraliomargarita parva TaxID=3014050 RepID=UPI0022B43CA3|nr:anthranilate phosphoribosyltransferase [Coraliomargarita parva]